jgi:hypothetical protein
MKEFYGMCGIRCSDCDAYIATQNDDDELRKKLARESSERAGREISPEEINCDGCIHEGRHIGYCAECDIRICGMKKEVLNCAYCEDYACEMLSKFFDMVPEAKVNLENLRKNL